MIPAWVEDVRLLVRLLFRDHDGVVNLLRERVAPTAELADFAVAHSLSAVLLGALAGSPLRDDLPAAAIDRLEQRRRLRATRANELLAELERLADLFDEQGQRFLLLKGPYLAVRLYGGVHGREYVDVDLLVPSAERARTFELLAAAGYAYRSRVALNTALTCYFVHGFDFAKGNCKLDLHWRLSRHPSFRIDDAALWARTQSCTIAGRSYQVLSDEYEIVFAALSLLRDVERGSAKIKNLIDLLQILGAADAQIDWDVFFRTRLAEGTLGPTVSIVGLCLDIAAAHDLVPRVSAALALHAQRRPTGEISAEPFRFPPLALGIGNKLWSARAHDTSLAGWAAWWAVSLPFRIAAHSRPRRPQPRR